MVICYEKDVLDDGARGADVRADVDVGTVCAGLGVEWRQYGLVLLCAGEQLLQLFCNRDNACARTTGFRHFAPIFLPARGEDRTSIIWAVFMDNP